MFLRKPREQTIAGKSSTPGGVNIPIEVIIPVLEHALAAAIFTAGGKVVRQIRGAFIGSPLSPPWCVAVVIQEEYAWISSLDSDKPLWRKRATAVRYVDNRMLAELQKNGIGNEKVENLRDNNFYRSPIVLEAEPENDRSS